MQHLQIHYMRDVEALLRSLYLLPDAFGSQTRTHEYGYYRRSVEDYQSPLVDVARIVSIPEPAYRDVRRLVKLDRFPAA